ncbi:MAG: hypothetical protein LBD10_09015 [Desulfobulbus sp.]|uniref:hypothetical protein n=1 Tax=Desulfobulbus sp. TaxID=895 RepID=UPI00284E7A9F|nr:hypothetical protein [Desulfobulbus sp.]MDR2550322.1 hypothetical protein [Desulfobulbus sp.]
MKNAIAALTFSVAVLFSGNVLPAVAGDALASVATGPGAGHVYTYEIPASLNSEERKWFQVFQEGNLLSEGWQDISAEILAKTPPEQRPAQKVALDNLGKKIGMEWCRPNAVRRVDSSMLVAWGDILRATARKNPQQLAMAIAYIDQKVDAALD